MLITGNGDGRAQSLGLHRSIDLGKRGRHRVPEIECDTRPGEQQES
jgi:hypothetical protein